MKSQGNLLKKMVQELTKEADAFATKAETKNKMDLFVISYVKCKEIRCEEKNIILLQL